MKFNKDEVKERFNNEKENFKSSFSLEKLKKMLTVEVGPIFISLLLFFAIKYKVTEFYIILAAFILLKIAQVIFGENSKIGGFYGKFKNFISKLVRL